MGCDSQLLNQYEVQPRQQILLELQINRFALEFKFVEIGGHGAKISIYINCK
jgi:hypothetical protein